MWAPDFDKEERCIELKNNISGFELILIIFSTAHCESGNVTGVQRQMWSSLLFTVNWGLGCLALILLFNLCPSVFLSVLDPNCKTHLKDEEMHCEIARLGKQLMRNQDISLTNKEVTKPTKCS